MTENNNKAAGILETLQNQDRTTFEAIAAANRHADAQEAKDLPSKPTSVLIVSYQTCDTRKAAGQWSKAERTTHLPPTAMTGKRFMRGKAAGMAEQLADVHNVHTVWHSDQWCWTVTYHRDGLAHRHTFKVYGLTG